MGANSNEYSMLNVFVLFPVSQPIGSDLDYPFWDVLCILGIKNVYINKECFASSDSHNLAKYSSVYEILYYVYFI